MAKTGDTFTITLKRPHLEWGSYRHTNSPWDSLWRRLYSYQAHQLIQNNLKIFCPRIS